ncbi:MAG: urease accessory protein UreE [Alphaproteobacteria bacterium]|nr:urease accessory protein UreE [Alphaproteobacteria bacterium]
MVRGPLVRAASVLQRGAWSGAPSDRVLLDYDARHRRRIRMTGAGGLTFLLDLPRPAALAQGDALQLEDGRLVEVAAAPEELLSITAPDDHTLLRLAWHLGNRHLPTEIQPGAVFIRYDHVIEEMVKKLGGSVERVHRPFQPEGGAYGPAHMHAHD